MLTAEASGFGAELSVLIAIKLNGVQTNGLVDSGAGPSVIDIGTVCALGLERVMKINFGFLYGISREPVHVVGNLDLTVDLGDKQVLEHTFEVLKDTGTICILGRDLLKKLGTTEFDWQSRQVRLGTTWKSSQATIEGGERISRASIAVLDATDLEQKSPRNLVNPDLSAEQKTALSNLVHTFEHVFAQNPKHPRLARGVTHCIDTGSGPPCKQRPIPVAPAVEEEISKTVNKMLRDGICRQSNSPWASRVLLVTKREGSRRFVVDYRQLNEVTRIDTYPMPNAKDIMDTMYGQNYFSFIESASAFWSIEVKESDKYKTAFVTQRGLYEMNRMPFGLVNSQASYQRLMDETLKHIDRADPFVDDTCIHSEDFEQHISDLELTFKTLEAANIQLRRDKCSFGYPSGEFLGHWVSKEGHSPILRLVNKIRQAQTPISKKRLQRFLGLANFYRE